jgi:cytochrome d ubiquinol oxidase subunit II
MERHYIQKRLPGKAFLASAVVIAGSILFGVLGLFPALLPSTLDAAYAITIRNGASTHLTLTIMLVVAVVFVPLVMIYQAWAYRFFRRAPSITPGSTTTEDIGEETY